MKTTGIVRKIDELGRIVLPIELRRTLGIGERDSIEIYVDGESIILKKYKTSCVFCSETDNLIDFKGKSICPSCLMQLKK
ncbi:MAG TPA: AbrB family transcriptional regulator [Ruminococcus sp.]|nr:AbrB family transcriptional regulator [Ruminococcus sp.]HCR74793.1 AbrB family transcriptional regulator [Ruminococcus sp.]